MNKIENFVWDFDGTLFDTYPLIIAILRQSLQQFGYDSQPKEVMQLLLENVAFARAHYAEKFGIDSEQLKQQVDIRWKSCFAGLESKPMEGVEQVLAKICANGKRNYIFTNRKCGETMDHLKKYGLDVYFQDIMGQDSEGFVLKPAPDALLHLMEKNDLDPAKTVMIGDRLCDLESGRGAGTKTAHIVCQMIPEDLQCDWRIESYSQMLPLL